MFLSWALSAAKWERLRRILFFIQTSLNFKGWGLLLHSTSNIPARLEIKKKKEKERKKKENGNDSYIIRSNSKIQMLIHISFFILFKFFPFIFIRWRLVTLQYYSGFAIHWHESAMDFWNIPPLPSLTESKILFCTSVYLFLFCI